jgi:SAM-dependent methyltransferase
MDIEKRDLTGGKCYVYKNSTKEYYQAIDKFIENDFSLLVIPLQLRTRLIKQLKILGENPWEKLISNKDYVLDVGCWSGEKILELLPQTKNAYGIDITNKKFHLANPKVKFRLKVADVTKKIPFKIK